MRNHPENMEEEKRIIQEVVNCWKCYAQKNPTYTYPCDYSLTLAHINIIGWVEVKRRYVKYEEYPDIMLSLQKWQRCIELSKLTKKPFLFIVNFDNGTYIYNYNEKDLITYTFSGRDVNTRDNRDIEPVANIPINLFKPLKKILKKRNNEDGGIKVKWKILTMYS